FRWLQCVFAFGVFRIRRSRGTHSPSATAPRSMIIRKVLITAANPRQRTLPLQTLIDQAGEPKSALQVVLEETAGAGIEEFGVVVCPGDERAYAEASGGLRDRVRFITQ